MDKPKANAANPMWGGRFSSGPSDILSRTNASIDFARRLYAQDIRAAQAHCAMLARQGIIAADDAKAIHEGLDKIKDEIDSGAFSFDRALEDIHMNVEGRLKDL